MMESLRKLPGLGGSIGATGLITSSNEEHSHTFTHSSPVNKQSSSQHLPPGCAPGLKVKEKSSALNLSRMRSRPSPRPAIWLGNKVPFTKQRDNTFFPLKDSSKDSEDNIPRQYFSQRPPGRFHKCHSSWPISQETPRYIQQQTCQPQPSTTSLEVGNTQNPER